MSCSQARDCDRCRRLDGSQNAVVQTHPCSPGSAHPKCLLLLLTALACESEANYGARNCPRKKVNRAGLRVANWIIPTNVVSCRSVGRLSLEEYLASRL